MWSAYADHITYTWNFLKAVFHKFYMAHSWILCLILLYDYLCFEFILNTLLKRHQYLSEFNECCKNLNTFAGSVGKTNHKSIILNFMVLCTSAQPNCRIKNVIVHLFYVVHFAELPQITNVENRCCLVK